MPDLRKPCPVTRDNGWLCDYVEHPGEVHVTWVNGWPQHWMARPEPWLNVNLNDGTVLADAPQALRQLGPERGSITGVLEAGEAAR